MSLHWILALTLTLTWLHCLTTHPINQYTKNAFQKISNLESLTCDEPDSTFYSPRPSDKEHIIQALNCSIQELKTVGEECFEKNSTGFQQANRLSDLIKEMLEDISVQNNSTHWSCEGTSRTRSYHNFLINVKKLIQALNSRQY